MGDAAAESQGTMLVQLTVAQLEQRIEAAVARAMQGQGAPANTQSHPKKYLKTKELAKAMGKTTRTIMNWIDDGVPHERVGHTYRFELAAVQEWDRQRRKR